MTEITIQEEITALLDSPAIKCVKVEYTSENHDRVYNREFDCSRHFEEFFKLVGVEWGIKSFKALLKKASEVE